MLWAWARGVTLPEELKRHAMRLEAADENMRQERRAKAVQAEYVARMECLTHDLEAEVARLNCERDALVRAATTEIARLNDDHWRNLDELNKHRDREAAALKEQFSQAVAAMNAMHYAAQSEVARVAEENEQLHRENIRLIEDWLVLHVVEPAMVHEPVAIQETEVKLDPRRETTRDRIALGLAMKFCDFEPDSQRSGSSRKVVDALAGSGILITERTVRPTLKSIHEELSS